MIEIYRKGRLNTDIKDFSCKYCSCGFTATKEDYEIHYYPVDSKFFFCAKCPCCCQDVITEEF